MSREQRRGPVGRGHGHGMRPGEKAKDFKGTIKKLVRYMSRSEERRVGKECAA